MLKKIIIGADHLGKNLKDEIKEHLESRGIEVMDVGVTDDSQVDYPDVGKTSVSYTHLTLPTILLV